MLSSKLWKQEEFEEQWKKGKRPMLAQSRGNARMMALPQRDDTVDFVFKGQIRMRGTVSSDGFLTGTAHQNDDCNEGTARPHAELNQFAWILINEVLAEPVTVPFTGQRTWLKKTWT
jgi:hypothetical protein